MLSWEHSCSRKKHTPRRETATVSHGTMTHTLGLTEHGEILDQVVGIVRREEVGELELLAVLATDRRGHLEVGVLLQQTVVLERAGEGVASDFGDGFWRSGTAELEHRVGGRRGLRLGLRDGNGGHDEVCMRV